MSQMISRSLPDCEQELFNILEKHKGTMLFIDLKNKSKFSLRGVEKAIKKMERKGMIRKVPYQDDLRNKIIVLI